MLFESLLIKIIKFKLILNGKNNNHNKYNLTNSDKSRPDEKDLPLPLTRIDLQSWLFCNC